MKLFFGLVLGASASLATCTAANAALLFDDFNSAGSASNYALTATSADTAVTYAYDYGAFGIPVAPKTTDGSTIGVKMEANMALPASIEAVTLHTLQTFSGKYRVEFDAYINANGPFPAGGTGSTEYLTFGVGSDGATPNRHNFSAGAPAGTGSGGWFAVDNEGQSSSVDYNAIKNSTFQLPATGQYAAGTVATAGGARDNSNAYYLPILPVGIDTSTLPYQGSTIPVTGFAQQNGTTQAGIFGFKWHEVTLEVDPAGGTGGAGSVQWFIDGLLIATLDAGANGAFSTSGSVTLGYLDPFTSVSGNPALSFGLFDNLTVTAIPEPGSVALMGLGCLAIVAARRKKA